MQITPVSHATEIVRRSELQARSLDANGSSSVHRIPASNDRRSPQERVIQGEVLEHRATAAQNAYSHSADTLYDFEQFMAFRPGNVGAAPQNRAALSSYQTTARTNAFEKSTGNLLDTFV